MTRRGIAVATAGLAAAFAVVLADQANPQPVPERVRVCATSPTARALIRHQPRPLTRRHAAAILRQSAPYWQYQDSRVTEKAIRLTGGTLYRRSLTARLVTVGGFTRYTLVLRFNRKGRGCGIARPSLSTRSIA